MNEFMKIKEFLDKHPAMVVKFEAEPEGIDQDTTTYSISVSFRKSDDVHAVSVRGPIFDDLMTNIDALIESANAVFGFQN